MGGVIQFMFIHVIVMHDIRDENGVEIKVCKHDGNVVWYINKNGNKLNNNLIDIIMCVLIL